MIKYILTLPIRFLAWIFGVHKNTSYMTVNRPDPVTGKMEKLLYTPYFIYDHLDAVNNFRLRIIITLGNERLPDGFTPTQDRDLINRVFEIYFLNDADQTQRFLPVSVKYGADSGAAMPFPSHELLIEPQTQQVSSAVTDLDIPFATELDFILQYKVNNQVFSLRAQAPRFTQQDMAEYMGRHS